MSRSVCSPSLSEHRRVLEPLGTTRFSIKQPTSHPKPRVRPGCASRRVARVMREQSRTMPLVSCKSPKNIANQRLYSSSCRPPQRCSSPSSACGARPRSALASSDLRMQAAVLVGARFALYVQITVTSVYSHKECAHKTVFCASTTVATL